MREKTINTSLNALGILSMETIWENENDKPGK